MRRTFSVTQDLIRGLPLVFDRLKKRRIPGRAWDDAELRQRRFEDRGPKLGDPATGFARGREDGGVRRGVFDVRASVRRLVSALSSELLPTLERPATAISGASGSGRNSRPGADFRNSTGPANSLRACSAKS